MLSRAASQGVRQRPTQTMRWPAPTKGWLASGNITEGDPMAAEQLDNWFPTAQAIRMRRGSTLHATLDDPGLRFMQFSAAGKLYVSTETKVFEISAPADAEVTPVPSLSGMLSGDWSSTQFATSGGSFMIAVNGTDAAWYTDALDINPITGETILNLEYDALTADFTIGETVTGGTSGATAELLAIAPATATTGTLKLGAITGTFQDNETITDGQGGSATSDIPSGTSTGSAVTITGVNTADLSQVWQYASRLFFIEENTLSAWYLPVDSIGGAASELPLGSIFGEGGSLLFGGIWSIDSGAGLDDKCVFVTTEGEIAVYAGTNPASASTWALEGVYKIGRPINKHAWFRAGGDFMIVTLDGIIPMSQAVQRERVALMTYSLASPIEDAWADARSATSANKPINATLWQSEGMLIVGTALKYDAKDVAFVANARTGAWCRYLGWDVVTAVEFDDRLFFADRTGLVFEGEVGGTDNGTGYTGVYVPKFSEARTTQEKIANHLQVIGRGVQSFTFNASCFSDYVVEPIEVPEPSQEADAVATWGAAVWGSFTWGDGGNLSTTAEWASVAAQGFSIAPGVAVTVEQLSGPVIQITGLQLRYEVIAGI